MLSRCFSGSNLAMHFDPCLSNYHQIFHISSLSRTLPYSNNFRMYFFRNSLLVKNPLFIQVENTKKNSQTGMLLKIVDFLTNFGKILHIDFYMCLFIFIFIMYVNKREHCNLQRITWTLKLINCLTLINIMMK